MCENAGWNGAGLLSLVNRLLNATRKMEKLHWYYNHTPNYQIPSC